MDFIPDDIWISIFEHIQDSPSLAALVRCSHRFHALASKLLLRELKWIKSDLTLRNIEAWSTVYAPLLALPRKITIGIPFEFTHAMRQPVLKSLSPEMKLYNVIYTQLLRFTSISHIVLDGTAVSPHTYSVLGQIPSLRSLHLENCTFINLHTQFHSYVSIAQSPVCPIALISSIPVKHLSLHRVVVPTEYENYLYHPLCLLTIPSITSLSITWNANIASRYAQNRWALPSLTELSVVMPLMSRDLLDELATFVHHCQLSPKVKLRIDKHNLSDTQIASVQVPSNGLWNYEGPLVIVASSRTNPTLTHVKINETLELPQLLDGLERLPVLIEELEVQVGKWDIELLFAIKDLFKKMKRLTVRYVRGVLPENLMVRLGADILFCLPDLISIKLLGPRDATTDLCTGSSNNCHSHAHTAMSVYQSIPTTTARAVINSEYHSSHTTEEAFEDNDELQFAGAGGPSHLTFHASPSPFQNDTAFFGWNTVPSLARDLSGSFALSSQKVSSSSSSSSLRTSVSRRAGGFAKNPIHSEGRNLNSFDTPESVSLSQAELGDYLIGWSRYCPSLRVVQIDHRWWWERRFMGDQWALWKYGCTFLRNNDT